MTKLQNDNWRESKIPLSQLVLWDENARFPDKYFTKSEKELKSYEKTPAKQQGELNY